MEYIYEWFSNNLDTIYYIGSVIVTTVVLPILGFWVKKKINQANIQSELQLQALKQVANREDNKPQLQALESFITKQNDSIVELQETIKRQGEMLDEVFQNSTGLDDVTKAKLHAIKAGMSKKDLVDENLKLSKRLDEMAQELTNIKNKPIEKIQEIIEPVKSKPSRIRR